MKKLLYGAVGLLSAVSVSTSASAAEVLYAFQLTPTSIPYDEQDPDAFDFYSRPTTGSFGFDTTTNELLSFNIQNWVALDFDPTAGYQTSYPAALQIFNAAGPCDLACFIGAINTGSFSIGYTEIRYQLNFGEPLNGSIVGTGPEQSGRPIDVAGTLRVTGPIPEPSTWAMMLMGFGAVGFAMRRRRRTELTIRRAA